MYKHTCRHADWKVPASRKYHEVPSRVKWLQFDENGKRVGEVKNYRSADESASNVLRNDLARFRNSRLAVSDSLTATSTRNLYILEGLNPEFVGVLGANFDIDPTFFSRHKRTALWEGVHEGGNTSKLPSADHASLGFMMEYCEILHFNEPPRGRQAMRNPHDNRHIDLSAKPEHLESNLDKVGNMHRKASFWVNADRGDDGWDGKSKVKMIVQPKIFDSG